METHQSRAGRSTASQVTGQTSRPTRGALCSTEVGGLLGVHFLWGVSWGRGLGTVWKVLASKGQIVCLFLWAPAKPNRGNFQRVSSHCTENIRWPFKGRKERSSCCWPTGYNYSRGVNMFLWTGLCQQQEVWQSQRHTSATQTLSDIP